MGVGGDPFSFQDASGELACLAIGASLGATANQTAEAGSGLSKARTVGNQYGYRPSTFTPDSPIWPFVRAYGLDTTANDAEFGLIYVNMLGQRFFQEDTRDYDWRLLWAAQYWMRIRPMPNEWAGRSGLSLMPTK